MSEEKLQRLIAHIQQGKLRDREKLEEVHPSTVQFLPVTV